MSEDFITEQISEIEINQEEFEEFPTTAIQVPRSINPNTILDRKTVSKIVQNNWNANTAIPSIITEEATKNHGLCSERSNTNSDLKFLFMKARNYPSSNCVKIDDNSNITSSDESFYKSPYPKFFLL